MSCVSSYYEYRRIPFTGFKFIIQQSHQQCRYETFRINYSLPCAGFHLGAFYFLFFLTLDQDQNMKIRTNILFITTIIDSTIISFITCQKHMIINSVNDQGTEGSSSCEGCDCPQIIRLNPEKDSNTTVVTSPRNFLS